jgi:lipoyl(octanoyl) transferase
VVEVQDWGLIDYKEALDRQMSLVESVASGEQSDTIIFCTHPEVVTIGRAGSKDELLGWKGPVYEINRGGKATYHGPDQLVIYPIINLTREGRPQRDIAWFLRGLEDAVVLALAEYGIESVGKSLHKNASNEEEDATGVWVGDRKICSLGIGVKKWTTFHGAAVCIHQNENAFRGLNPCGFTSNVMTSLEEEAGERIDSIKFQKTLEPMLIKAFQH